MKLSELWNVLVVGLAVGVGFVLVETNLVAEGLKRATGCLKINTGALGNVVRQLHIHVVARNEGDPNWPGPVWGAHPRIPREAGAREAVVARLLPALSRLTFEESP